MSNKQGCRGCGFSCNRGEIKCQYCLITGQPRGCPVGKGCDKRMTRAKVDKLRKQTQRAGLTPVEPWEMAWEE